MKKSRADSAGRAQGAVSVPETRRNCLAWVVKWVLGTTRGKARGLLSLRRNMWALAGKGNASANIFLSKNLLGYRDYFSNEHSGPNGGPIVIGPALELGRLTNEDIKQLASLVGKAGFPGKG